MDEQSDNTQQDAVEKEQTTRPRVRHLTPKGTEIYEQTFENQIARLNKKWLELDGFLQKANLEGKDLVLSSLIDLDKNIREHAEKLRILMNDFLDFLKRTSTEESLQKLN